MIQPKLVENHSENVQTQEIADIYVHNFIRFLNRAGYTEIASFLRQYAGMSNQEEETDQTHNLFSAYLFKKGVKNVRQDTSSGWFVDLDDED